MAVQVLKKGDVFSIKGYKNPYEFVKVDGVYLRVINKEGRETLILKPKDKDIILNKETK